MATHLQTTDGHEFVRQFFAMANAHDFARLPQFLHDDVIVNGARITQQAITAQFMSYDAAVPDLHWKVLDAVVEADRIALRLLDSGTPVGSFFGLEPTGASVSFTEVAFWQIVDGRLSEMSFVFDIDTLRGQLA